MTLNKEDSIGPTPLLQGSPLRRWRALDQTGDLLDVYHAAGRTEGPFFTRQAAKGNRLDQSRLDRVYLSEMGSWVHAISLVKHFEKLAVSDHIPVLVDLAIKPPRKRSRRRRSSYIKMDEDAMKDPVFLADLEVQKVWQEGYSMSTCPITAWSLAWGKVQRLYGRRRALQQQQRGELTRLKEKLGEMRMKLADDPNAVPLEEYKAIEAKVREDELQECEIARRRSRHRWLKSGDAPTRYFYAVLKSKQNAEALTVLTKEDGSVLEDEDEILGEVHSFYGELRGRTMLKADKSPGADGLTAEVLRTSWSWTKAACYALIKEFWRTGRLGKNDVMGVIKLLAKSEEKHFLRNWRPITNLAMTYKIISKLLAERLKKILPQLIDEEQTGFVEQRSIVDNFLCLKLGQELAEHIHQESLFCKLDFVKAFDRVQHHYLIATMEAMHFDPV
ncbi:hypothetical protein R1sor_010762 [Riccia sorocarpa]|uniref:Reverse transcriptase domain-containing protein n=1 Tax=Riccia sorocarpa TaxID=122646 RepID=A0ABD3I306_9MARC